MIDSNPYTFNPHRRHAGHKIRALRAQDERGVTLDAPPAYAPGCPVEERAAALEALAKMHAERPLKPPGRRP